MNEKTKQILSYVFGWIGGLIVLFAIKENERNTKFHAAQSIVLSGGCTILSILPIPFLSLLLWILFIGGAIWQIVKIFQDEENIELPFIGKVAIKIFGSLIEKDEEN